MTELERTRALLVDAVKFIQSDTECPACSKVNQVVVAHKRGCRTIHLCQDIRRFELTYGALV